MKEYDDILSELYVRFPSVQNAGFNTGAYKPGLEHMLEFDRVLGRPSHAIRTIHVAGTNGKGSVSSMLASSLAASGLRVGLYTSPHLLDFRERMRIISDSGVEMISKDDVLTFVREWSAAFDSLNLSFFEITTGMALWWFAREKADIAVIEVGLGGRLDSTNIITPELSVITSIGLDHCAMLGGTREAIAGEKAGIFKPGVPAVVATRDEETSCVFEAKAQETGCPLTFADGVCVGGEDEILSAMDLRGGYQGVNLHTCIVALDIMGVPVNRDALVHTAARTGFRGRWERLMDAPEMICDIGHNPPALQWNFAQLREDMASGRHSDLIMVYGVMADKDLDGIMPLMPEDATWIYTTPDTPRALPSDKILQRCRDLREKLGLDTSRLHAAASVREALEKALSMAGPETLIYVGGSTFVVADAMKCDILSKKSPEHLQNQK